MYYQDCQHIEAQGVSVLKRYAKYKTGNDLIPITDKLLQQTLGDFLITSKKIGVATLEVKTERRITGNLFVETFSNREWSTLGWLYTSKAELLWTYWLDRDHLTCVSLPSLREWLLNKEAPQIANYREIQVRQVQSNDTWGIAVPLDHLRLAKLDHWYECNPLKELPREPN